MNPASSATRENVKTASARKGVELFTLGEVRVKAGGVDVTERMGARHRALLVYLVHEARPVDPAELIELVGRGGAEEAERASLKKAVVWLDEHIPGLRLELSRDSVSLGSHVWWDVREMDDALDRHNHRAVARLYRGDYLEGFSFGNVAFDEWARDQRRRLREYWDGAIRAAAAESEGASRWEEAADWWRVLADRNPLAGDFTVRAMRAYGRAKQRGESARVYEAYLGRVAAQRSAVDNAVEQTAAELSIPRPANPAAGGSAAGATQRSEQRSEPERARSRVVEPRRPARDPTAAIGSVSFGPPTSRAATDPHAALGLDDDDEDVQVSVYHRAPKHLRRLEDPGIFTDSVFVYGLKTFWAKLTTPRAIRRYKEAVEQFIQATVNGAQAALYWIGVGGQLSWKYGGRAARATGRGAREAATQARVTAGRVGKEVGHGVARAGRATAQGASAASAATGRAGRGLGRGVGRGVALTAKPVWAIPRLVVAAFRPLLALPGLVLKALRPLGRLPRLGLAGLRALWAVPRLLLAALRPLLLVPRVLLMPLRWLRSRSSSAVHTSRSVGRGLARVGSPGSSKRFALRPAVILTAPARALASLARTVGLGLRRRRTAVALACAAVALLLAVPIAGDMATPLVRGVRERLASLSDGGLPSVDVPTVTIRKPTLPKVELPRVTIPKPDIASAVPSLVTEPVEKLGAMLAGPLLDNGQRLVVADITDGGAASGPGLGHLAALLLEAELAGSRHFSVVPRERAALADRDGRGADLGLPGSAALALSRSVGAAAVVTGRFDEGEDGAIGGLRLAVLDVGSGMERYGFDVEVADGDWIGAVTEAARRLSRRLGEEADEIAPLDAPPVLSASLPALGAYSRARADLFSGRYGAAAARLQDAIRHDTAFAAGYQLLAQARALQGRRAEARAALDAAYRHRYTLSERERLRVLADREALRGRNTDAIIAYEYLFQNYRDDVAALKSLALLQRRLGAIGGGTGNLDVAYAIEPLDWPPLSRIARYLGYGGRLPATVIGSARRGSHGLD